MTTCELKLFLECKGIIKDDILFDEAPYWYISEILHNRGKFDWFKYNLYPNYWVRPKEFKPTNEYASFIVPTSLIETLDLKNNGLFDAIDEVNDKNKSMRLEYSEYAGVSYIKWFPFITEVDKKDYMEGKISFNDLESTRIVKEVFKLDFITIEEY